MKNNKSMRPTPVEGIWRRFLVLVPLAMILGLLCLLHVRSVGSVFEAWTPVYDYGKDYGAYDMRDVELSNKGVVEVTAVDAFPTGAARLTLHALSDGETSVSFGDQKLQTLWKVSVKNGIIVEGSNNFSGWRAIHISFCVFLLVVVVLFGSVLVRLWRVSWYGYEMVAAGGALLFCLFQLAVFSLFFARESLNGFGDMSYELKNMAIYFVILLVIPVSLASIIVSLSNISLMRHEGRRLVNLLGVAVSVIWFMSLHFWSNWERYARDWGLSTKIQDIVASVITVGLSFGVCLLVSTIACAWLASRHVPRHAADYVVILGCGLRADGTPCPLLAGRVDKALDFEESCVREGDASAIFVPSGGQGPDEVMSEAQSMANYLGKRGVGKDHIVLEDRSSTTRENMAFSREVIERHSGRDVSELRVAFSTTNYHVFRGYVCAHDAGMEVEGMGSKTKAYFWPNAFLREFAGLLVSQWKGILQVFVVIELIYLGITNLLL